MKNTQMMTMAIALAALVGCAKEDYSDPEAFADRLAVLPQTGFFRAVFEDRETMIDLDAGDTYMTVYNAREAFAERLRKLAEAEGLFLR